MYSCHHLLFPSSFHTNEGMISGAVAGLVCITPASGYVDMTGAFFIGFFGGPITSNTPGIFTLLAKV